MAFMYMIQQPPFLKELEKKGIILNLFEDHLWDEEFTKFTFAEFVEFH